MLEEIFLDAHVIGVRKELSEEVIVGRILLLAKSAFSIFLFPE